MAQQVAVVLDEGAAATGRLDQAFGTALQRGPPRIDVAPCPVQPGLLCIEVVIHGTAAAGWLTAVMPMPRRSSTRAVALLVLGDRPG